MNIALDAGALNTSSNEQFGTYSFTKQFMKALGAYDKENNYICYTLNDVEIDSCAHNIECKTIWPKVGWMQLGVPLVQIRYKPDIFLALSQAIPTYVGCPVIAFSHGLSFFRYPEYYPGSYQRLKGQLLVMVKRARYIVVSSSRVKDEMVQQFPKVTGRIVVLPFGLPEEYISAHSVKRNRDKTILYVGSGQGIKNVGALIRTIQKLRSSPKFAEYKLRIIGHTTTDKNEVEGVEYVGHLNQPELIAEYRQAAAYFTASHYESFNYPVLEALSQSCPVVGLESAIIPEMQKYCTVVAGEQELVPSLEKVLGGSSVEINLTQLQAEFWWERYVKKLQELYRRLDK